MYKVLKEWQFQDAQEEQNIIENYKNYGNTPLRGNSSELRTEDILFLKEKYYSIRFYL